VDKLLQHKHLIVRALVQEPPKLPELIIQWKRDLIRAIGMKVMLGPYAAYSWLPGNRGLTAVTVIETSHIALHVWDEQDPALFQLDVYTCSDLDIKAVFDALEQFKPVKVTSRFLDRELDIDDLSVDFNL
jgi:S-adenosylmethionine/arginine decarboxylase-like enzyme